MATNEPQANHIAREIVKHARVLYPGRTPTVLGAETKAALAVDGIKVIEFVGPGALDRLHYALEDLARPLLVEPPDVG